jgi:predicted HTH transcriptional regulator
MVLLIAEMKINEAILFPEHLPKSYQGNLMSIDEYSAVIEDKTRWSLAMKMLKQPRHITRSTLDGIADERLREDIRRRLNALVNKGVSK